MHKAAGEDVFYEMEEALIKRILPHSIEAEQSVIGSMILDRDAILVASEILTSDDFYQSQYGIIFDAMVELCNEGKPVDLITLQNRLKEKELPPDISSMEYVRDLISAVPTSANVKYFQAARKHPKECRSTRLDIDQRGRNAVAEWKSRKRDG